LRDNLHHLLEHCDCSANTAGGTMKGWLKEALSFLWFLFICAYISFLAITLPIVFPALKD